MHVGADHGLAPQGADPFPDRPDATPAGRAAAGRAQGNLVLNPDQQRGVGRHPGRPPLATAPDDSRPRRDRQRQDRGLHPGDPGGGPLRAAGDRAGAGDQPDAADRRSVPPPFRRGGGAAQPPERRRAALALAADCRGRGAGGGRRPQRDLRPHAAPGPDRAGRGAREFVQAGDGPALSRPGRGDCPGRGGRGAAGAGLGDALAGELAPGAAGAVHVGRDAAPGAGPPHAAGRHHRPPQRRAPAGNRAGPSAARCTRPSPPRWTTAGR